jgi:THO complex subunit 3
MFSHTGDSMILTCAIHIVDVPSLVLRENVAAHVGSCVDSALGPRGRCLTSGRYDLIVNLFDTNKWIAVRTITICECMG